MPTARASFGIENGDAETTTTRFFYLSELGTGAPQFSSARTNSALSDKPGIAPADMAEIQNILLVSIIDPLPSEFSETRN